MKKKKKIFTKKKEKENLQNNQRTRTFKQTKIEI